MFNQDSWFSSDEISDQSSFHTPFLALEGKLYTLACKRNFPAKNISEHAEVYRLKVAHISNLMDGWKFLRNHFRVNELWKKQLTMASWYDTGNEKKGQMVVYISLQNFITNNLLIRKMMTFWIYCKLRSSPVRHSILRNMWILFAIDKMSGTF